MSEWSILRNVTRADIRREPFAHMVIEGCLPSTLYAELARTFPSDDTILRLSRSSEDGRPDPNSRHDVSAQRILENSGSFSPSWRQFVQYHVSNEFYRELAALMGPEIRAAHPSLEQRLGRPLNELRTGVLGALDTDGADVGLDCHIGINTPSPRRGSVRRVHTDAVDELFAALIYFRAERDAQEGGDLEIFGWKDNRPRRFVGSEVAESDAQLSHTVAANANTAVIFVNSIDALHAVTARAASKSSRRLVNIMGRVPQSVPEGLFEKRQKTDLRSRVRHLLQRSRIASGRF